MQLLSILYPIVEERVSVTEELHCNKPACTLRTKFLKNDERMVYEEIWPWSSSSGVGGKHSSEELFEHLVIRNIRFLQVHMFSVMEDRSRRGHHYGETRPGHLHPLLEHRRLTCHGRQSSSGLRGGRHVHAL